MSRHALWLLTNVDAETHTTKHRPTSPATTPPGVALVPAASRRFWGRTVLEAAMMLGLL